MADNGCFGAGFPGGPRWWMWLKYHPDRATCTFATAPDVVGDAVATLRRSGYYLNRIRDLGYPPALVAQDGMEDCEIPWASFEVLFIGGSTEWKMSRAAMDLVAEAQARGVSTHMGRVNTRRRLLYAHAHGIDSVDGTYLSFGPGKNLPTLINWLTYL